MEWPTIPPEINLMFISFPALAFPHLADQEKGPLLCAGQKRSAGGGGDERGLYMAVPDFGSTQNQVFFRSHDLDNLYGTLK